MRGSKKQRPSDADARGRQRKDYPIGEDEPREVLNREQLAIAAWLRKVRFRKKIFGGVNEQEVWKKIEELNKMYEAALKAERLRCDVLLEQQSQLQDPYDERSREKW